MVQRLGVEIAASLRHVLVNEGEVQPCLSLRQLGVMINDIATNSITKSCPTKSQFRF